MFVVFNNVALNNGVHIPVDTEEEFSERNTPNNSIIRQRVLAFSNLLHVAKLFSPKVAPISKSTNRLPLASVFASTQFCQTFSFLPIGELLNYI